MDFGFAGVPAITVICLLLAQLVKQTPINDKWIPIFCGVLGGILGVIQLYVIPEFPAHDLLAAIAIGITSGLAATGIHQIGKQLTEN